MKFLAFLAFFLIAITTVLATDDEHTLLSATTTNQVQPYRLLTRGQAAVVPLASNFRLTSVQPALSSSNPAQYKITLTFDRGCTSDDSSLAQTHFPALHCVYTNAGFQGCTEEGSVDVDGFFVVGQEVYFTSAVELKVQLVQGVRVDVSLPVTAVIVDDMYCDGLNAQETVVEIINHLWLIRDYVGLIPYLDANILFTTNVFAYDYVGIPVVIGYFMLGDPSVADAFETYNSSRLSSSSRGNVVDASYWKRIKSLQLPEGSNMYEDDQQQRVRFSKYNQVVEYRFFVNTALAFAMYPQSNHPDPDHVCTIADTHCTGPLQQYVDHADCMAFMSSRPVLKVGSTAQPVGVDDVACRGFHASLALAYPQGHCMHVGPFDARTAYGDQGLLVTPCVDDYPVPGQMPLRPLPTTTSRSVASRRVNHDPKVCDSDLCRYTMISKENVGGAPLGTLAFDHMMVNSLIPAAGQVVQNYVDTH